jgi:hypothetical protein
MFIFKKGDYHFKQLPFLIFGVSCFVSALSALALPRVEKEKNKPEIKVDTSPQLLQNK